jgi:hypothetical protein
MLIEDLAKLPGNPGCWVDSSCKLLILNMSGGGLSLLQTVLWFKFPANREFYREILIFWDSVTRGAALHAAQLTVLSSLWLAFQAQEEQGSILK